MEEEKAKFNTEHVSELPSWDLDPGHERGPPYLVELPAVDIVGEMGRTIILGNREFMPCLYQIQIRF